MMKKIINHIILLLLVLIQVSSCTKKLEELYIDPDLLMVGEVDKLFTELVNNYRTRPSYWEYRTFVALHTGIYSQTLGYLNTTGVYQQNSSYTQDKWNDFYRPAGFGSGTMALYRSMSGLYSELNEAEKKNAEIFLKNAEIVLYDQATQMVDLWGDIPFSDAGSLNATGEPLMAKFDTGAEIYENAINRLGALNTYLANVQLTTVNQLQFSTQDIFLNGDLKKWQQYCNALRLRLLMRISMVHEASAREKVLEILQHPDQFPLLQTSGIYQPEISDILLQPLADYVLDLRDALTEITSLYAPYYMLEELMKPVDDPRIRVFFDKYGTYSSGQFLPNAAYNAMPVDWTLEEQQINLGKFAILDSATFLFNPKLPGIVFTSAEQSFLLAEATLRWGGGNPDYYYKQGIQQSIEFYYYLNQLNSEFKQPEVLPDAASMLQFLESPSLQLTGSMEDRRKKIAEQKWLNYCFLQANQAWAELRRTGFPKLDFRVSSQPQAARPPNRLLYPGNEKVYNSNYSTVQYKDKTDYPIFWQNR